MARALVLLTLLALSTPLLAGCLEGGAGEGSLTRSIVAVLKENSLEGIDGPADVAQLAKTSFSFAPAQTFTVAGATVAYTDPVGNAVERPLANFTRHTTIEKGESVIISGVAFYSGLTIRQGGNIVMARTGRTADWLTYGGNLLPLAASPGAQATYQVSSSGTLGLAFDRFTPPGADGASVQDFHLDSAVRASGTMALGASTDSGAVKVLLHADLESSVHLNATATVQSPDGNGPAGAKFSGKSAVKGDMAARFVARELTEGGAGGLVTADFTLGIRQPGATTYTDFPTDHPAFSHNVPFAWHSAPAETQEPAAVQTFLTQLYGMTLVPGDYIQVKASSTEPVGFDFTYTLSVAALQDRTVGDHTFHALKILGTVGFAMTSDAKADTVHSFAFTYWVDADSLLPIELAWQGSETLSRADLAGVLDLVGRESGLVMPRNVTVTSNGASNIVISHFSPGFQATVVGGAMGLMMPLVAMAVVGATTAV